VLIDEDAAYDALRSGHLAGAAFDVVRIPDLSIPPELGRRHRLLDAPNVILATHIGGATYETMAHGGEMAAAEIERLVAGKPLVNLANKAVLEKVANRG
jgi:D-3-phosphoglycerate dehydrogenase / 2-oxoglutarate reductase